MIFFIRKNDKKLLKHIGQIVEIFDKLVFF